MISYMSVPRNAKDYSKTKSNQSGVQRKIHFSLNTTPSFIFEFSLRGQAQKNPGKHFIAYRDFFVRDYELRPAKSSPSFVKTGDKSTPEAFEIAAILCRKREFQALRTFSSGVSTYFEIRSDLY